MEVRQGKMSLVAKGPSYSMGHGGESTARNDKYKHSSRSINTVGATAYSRVLRHLGHGLNPSQVVNRVHPVARVRNYTGAMATMDFVSDVAEQHLLRVLVHRLLSLR